VDSKEKAIAIVKRYAGALQQRKVPVKLLILFGSQARGTAGPDSDLDVLVVVERMDKKIRGIIIDEAFELSLQEGKDLLALPCSLEEFQSPLFQADAFYQNVQREGVIVS